jgi:hypothetical protein
MIFLISTNILLGFSFGLLNVTSTNVIVPVITRSQVTVSIGPNNVLLLLSQNTTSIGSNDGLLMSQSLSAPIGSNDGLSVLRSTVIGSSDGLSFTIPDTTNIDYFADPSSSSLLVPSSMNIPNCVGDNFNLKFSNSCSFKNLEDALSSSDVSHNSSNSNYLS